MFPAEQSERFSFQAVIGRCNLAQQIVGQLLCVHTLRGCATCGEGVAQGCGELTDCESRLSKNDKSRLPQKCGTPACLCHGVWHKMWRHSPSSSVSPGAAEGLRNSAVGGKAAPFAWRLRNDAKIPLSSGYFFSSANLRRRMVSSETL